MIIFLVVGGIVYKTISSSAAKKKKSQYTVKKEDLTEVLTLSGEIDAEEQVALRFQTSGRLVWVGVKEGDHVQKYQGIASLDQRTLKKNLEKSLRDYAKERLDHDQDIDVTYKDSPLTSTVRRVLEKNQYDLEKAVLDVELDDIALEYSYLYSPIDGVVTRVETPYAGVNITPTTAEFEIVNPDTVFFSVTADQTEIVDMKTGMKGEIIFDSFPEEEVSGEIIWLGYAPKDDETGTVYEVKVKFTTGKPFRLGMTGDINFVTKQKKGIIAIPDIYLKKDKKGDYVLVTGKKDPVKRYVKIGDEIDSKTEITSGLAVGEKIYD